MVRKGTSKFLDYPVIDSTGNVIEVEGLCHDVTEARVS